MATIIPALYYSTLNTKMEGYYPAIMKLLGIQPSPQH